MRMKMGWKLLNRNTRRGTPKRRGGTKREHQHQHTLPGAGEPWKGKGKEKRRPTEEHQDKRRGGEDGRAWTNLTPAKTRPTWAHTEPNLPGEGKRAWNRDPWGPSWWKTKPTKRDSVPKCKGRALLPFGTWSVNPVGHRQPTGSLIRCTTGFPCRKRRGPEQRPVV